MFGASFHCCSRKPRHRWRVCSPSRWSHVCQERACVRWAAELKIWAGWSWRSNQTMDHQHQLWDLFYSSHSQREIKMGNCPNCGKVWSLSTVFLRGDGTLAELLGLQSAEQNVSSLWSGWRRPEHTRTWSWMDPCPQTSHDEDKNGELYFKLWRSKQNQTSLNDHSVIFPHFFLCWLVMVPHHVHLNPL